jgi:hypothetical protein
MLDVQGSLHPVIIRGSEKNPFLLMTGIGEDLSVAWIGRRWRWERKYTPGPK